MVFTVCRILMSGIACGAEGRQEERKASGTWLARVGRREESMSPRKGFLAQLAALRLW